MDNSLYLNDVTIYIKTEEKHRVVPDKSLSVTGSKSAK